LLVAVEERVEQVQRPEAGLGRLGQQQERQRPEQHRACLDAVPARLAVFGQRLVPGQPQLRARPQLGHQVLVVRGKPVGRLERRDPGGTAGHREVGVQPVQAGEPPGDGVEQHGRVQHVVAERERIGRDVGQSGIAQGLPDLLAQAGGRLLQVSGGRPAGPVGLGRRLQFPPRADPEVSKDGCLHGCVSSPRAGMRTIRVGSLGPIDCVINQ
jgi:hypothetical protein